MNPSVEIDAPAVLKPNPVLKFIRTYLLERTAWRIPRTDKVLDFCCGWGFYSTINPNTWGVEGNARAVEYLRSRGRSVVQADVLAPLPFDDGRFEWVLAHDCLEHFAFEELQLIVKNVHRVLAPGGHFVVWVPNRRGYDYGFEIDAGHKLFVTKAEISELIPTLFELEKHYPEPLPRSIGKFSAHNKEVFFLRRI